jgi:hypothetical protein
MWMFYVSLASCVLVNSCLHPPLPTQPPTPPHPPKLFPKWAEQISVNTVSALLWLSGTLYIIWNWTGHQPTPPSSCFLFNSQLCTVQLFFTANVQTKKRKTVLVHFTRAYKMMNFISVVVNWCPPLGLFYIGKGREKCNVQSVTLSSGNVTIVQSHTQAAVTPKTFPANSNYSATTYPGNSDPPNLPSQQ